MVSRLKGKELIIYLYLLIIPTQAFAKQKQMQWMIIETWKAALDQSKVTFS